MTSPRTRPEEAAVQLHRLRNDDGEIVQKAASPALVPDRGLVPRRLHVRHPGPEGHQDVLDHLRRRKLESGRRGQRRAFRATSPAPGEVQQQITTKRRRPGPNNVYVAVANGSLRNDGVRTPTVDTGHRRQRRRALGECATETCTRVSARAGTTRRTICSTLLTTGVYASGDGDKGVAKLHISFYETATPRRINASARAHAGVDSLRGDGDLGIGTTDPLAKVHISSPFATARTLSRRRTSVFVSCNQTETWASAPRCARARLDITLQSASGTGRCGSPPASAPPFSFFVRRFPFRRRRWSPTARRRRRRRRRRVEKRHQRSSSSSSGLPSRLAADRLCEFSEDPRSPRPAWTRSASAAARFLDEIGEQTPAEYSDSASVAMLLCISSSCRLSFSRQSSSFSCASFAFSATSAPAGTDTCSAKPITTTTTTPRSRSRCACRRCSRRL